MMKPPIASVSLLSGLAALVALIAAPQRGDAQPAQSPLTAADIIEIQQLAVRDTYGLDASAGIREALPRRFIVNHIVDPAPGGATGRVYVVEADLPANGGTGGTLTSIGGIYEDVYSKTASGWRFKSRQFVPSKAAVRPAVTAANIARPPAAAPAAPRAAASAAPSSGATNAPKPTTGPGVKPLAPSDYIAIQQLVARYSYAVDTGAAITSLFTPDRAFEGTEIVTRRGPNNVAHFQTNHLIEPTAGGAVGKVYVLVLTFGENGQPHSISAGGAYEDVYARSADGWRFKARRIHRGRAVAATVWQWMPSQVPVRPAAQDVSTSGPMTSSDYLDIRRLVANYAYGLDGGADEGGVYADNFAPGASLFGQVRSRDDMKALANREPHGPQFTRHFLTNVLIEPGPSGPVGKQYLAVIDISEEGKESAIYLGGSYDDEYVKTSQGWKFKTRSLTRANAPAAPATSAAPR